MEKIADSVLLLPASGRGKRFGSPFNKVLADLGPFPVFMHSVLLALQISWIKSVVLIVRQEEKRFFEDAIERFHHNGADPFSGIMFAAGCGERHLSVRNGLVKAWEQSPSDYVLVHDAARPLASKQLFERVKAGLGTNQAVFPALPVVETLRRKSPGGIFKVNREEYLRAQTPQAFHGKHADLFFGEDYEKSGDTDEISCFERNGLPVCAVEGEHSNIKITSPEDLAHAEYLLNAKKAV